MDHMSQMVEFSTVGAACQAYLALPTKGNGMAVIVIQEWWGLVGHIKSVADRFAQEGFIALAPDFYDGKMTTEPDEAGSMMMALDIGTAGQKIVGAVDYLHSLPEHAAEKIGVVGFCMGGQLALFASCLDARIGGCVNFYGIHPNVSPNFDTLGCPVLGHFAEHDPYATPEAVVQLKADIEQAGKMCTFHTYPGTQHAFFNDDRPQVFDAAASAMAWDRTIAFLKGNL